MRRTIIAGLMAAGMLAGCGGTSDGELSVSCANGTTCTGSAAECTEQCGLSNADEKHASWVTIYCCDGYECRSPISVSFCVDYCQQYHEGTC
ncbi:hypothetical protein D7V97_08375 [Corallococcus sp. CA053C]|uniref:hypothetical protein n=1 Tax=Corallococcus sp. CA053C TaxID=2316732 RepID=UPI000EA0BA97|nr:hypothetical protein [Corallococcus sp. CA053C]RKH12445.1 hypothetical protein D7V97_08375 [Corallococcus sp. CA053C]